MLGALFLLVACVGFFVIGGVIFMFSLLFSRRRRMWYGYPRRRSFFPWFFGRPFMGRGFYEGRPRYEDFPRHEHHHEHHHGGGFGGGHGGHH
jgi:hypothetical protein